MLTNATRMFLFYFMCRFDLQIEIRISFNFGMTSFTFKISFFWHHGVYIGVTKKLFQCFLKGKMFTMFKRIMND